MSCFPASIFGFEMREAALKARHCFLCVLPQRAHFGSRQRFRTQGRFALLYLYNACSPPWHNADRSGLNGRTVLQTGVFDGKSWNATECLRVFPVKEFTASSLDGL